MLRTAKPKLSLSISTAAQASSRPSLSIPKTPISPSPMSPTAINTRMNKRGFSSHQQSSYSYTNSSSAKSILKKGSNSSSPGKRCQFSTEPTVHCVTPIENKEDYYGAYVKMSRDEKRWGRH